MLKRAQLVSPSGPLTRRIRHGWAVELAGGAAVYLVYDRIRDLVVGGDGVALRHARQVVALERFLGFYWERVVQQAFRSVDWFIAFWNIYYGTIHFVVPFVVLVWLYRKAPARYVRWRNTLLFMLAAALLSFWLYPLMPPRLMPARYGFVDTAANFFNFGPQVRIKFGAGGEPTAAAVQAFGNLFAAMPSLHVGWSVWSVLAIWPLVRRTWVRVLLSLYPLSIAFCIVVTANHWILDTFGGLTVLGIAYAGAWALDRARRDSRYVRRSERTRL